MNLPILALNFTLAILLAPLIDGMRRKITARLQNRIGPPILQSWFDLMKLIKKEVIVPEKTGVLFIVIPTFSLLLSFFMFATISTVTTQSPLNEGGIVFIELAVLSAFLFAFAGSISRNPYGVIGGSREVILSILVEPSIIVSLLSLILFKGSTTFDDSSRYFGSAALLSVAALAYILSLLAENGKIPFDLAEAESELSGGALIEFSGPLLAILKLSIWVRSLALFSILKFYLIALIPANFLSQGFIIDVFVYFISLLFCTVIISLAESLNARFKLLEASKFYAGVFALSLMALIITFLTYGTG